MDVTHEDNQKVDAMKLGQICNHVVKETRADCGFVHGIRRAQTDEKTPHQTRGDGGKSGLGRLDDRASNRDALESLSND
jgi:hypothetical protein